MHGARVLFFPSLSLPSDAPDLALRGVPVVARLRDVDAGPGAHGLPVRPALQQLDKHEAEDDAQRRVGEVVDRVPDKEGEAAVGEWMVRGRMKMGLIDNSSRLRSDWYVLGVGVDTAHIYTQVHTCTCVCVCVCVSVIPYVPRALVQPAAGQGAQAHGEQHIHKMCVEAFFFCKRVEHGGQRLAGAMMKMQVTCLSEPINPSPVPTPQGPTPRTCRCTASPRPWTRSSTAGAATPWCA